MYTFTTMLFSRSLQALAIVALPLVFPAFSGCSTVDEHPSGEFTDADVERYSRLADAGDWVAAMLLYSEYGWGARSGRDTAAETHQRYELLDRLREEAKSAALSEWTLARASVDRGNYYIARKYFQSSLSLADGLIDKQSVTAFDFYLEYARCLLQLDKTTEASTLTKKARAIAEAALEEGDSKWTALADVESKLGSAKLSR